MRWWIADDEQVVCVFSCHGQGTNEAE